MFKEQFSLVVASLKCALLTYDLLLLDVTFASIKLKVELKVSGIWQTNTYDKLLHKQYPDTRNSLISLHTVEDVTPNSCT